MATLTQLIPYAINASIFVLVFALGVRAHRQDILYLIRRPGLLIRSMISMNVVMVFFAALAAAALDMPRPVEIALIAISISPVPPIMPGKQIKAGGSASYALSLLVAASITSVILAPLAIGAVGLLFHRETVSGLGRISMVILTSILFPLGLGIAARIAMPGRAPRLAAILSRTGTILLALAVLPVLFTATSTIWTFAGDGVLAILVAFALTGLAVGHLLGGPQAENRTVLALATSTRHPGVAMALASLNAPGEKAVMAVILYHLLVGAIVALPYIKWRLGAGRLASPNDNVPSEQKRL